MSTTDPQREDLQRELAELRSTVSRLERSQAMLQRELQKSQVLLGALEHSANGTLLVAPDRTIVYVNSAFADMVGYSAEELVGKSTDIFNTAQIEPSIFQDVVAVTSASEIWRGELRSTTQSGETFWMHITLSPILDDQHQITYFLGITEDITARKQAELAQQESEIRYRALIEMSPDFIVVHRDGILLYVNPATYRIFAAGETDRFVGRSIYEFVHPDARDIVAQRMKNLAAGQPIELREIEYVRMDGEVISAEISSTVIEYEGEPAVLSVGRDVTSRKWVEDTLRVTEAHFRMVVESIRDTVFTLDTEGRFTAMYGYLPSTVYAYIHKTIHEIDAPDVRAAHVNAFSKALAGETAVFTWETARDDSTAYFQTSLSPLRDEDGAIIGVVGIGRDITDLKLAETELQLWQERYEMAQRAASIGVWDWIVETGEIYGSEMVRPILGLEPEIVGSTFEIFMDYVHPDDRQIVLDAAQDAVANREMYDVEVRVVRPDGAIRWVLVRGDVVFNDAGAVHRVVGIIQDITHRKQIVNALRESEERYRLLVELSPEAILVHRDGLVLYANAAAFRLFRAERPDQLIGHHAHEFTTDETRQLVSERIERLNQGDQVPVIEQRFLRADGTPLYLELISSPIMYEGEQSALMILRDVTDRKLAEVALRESEERYRLLVELSPEAILVHREGVIQYANAAGVRLFRVDRLENLIGRHVAEFVDPEAWETIDERIKNLAQGEHVPAIEQRFAGADRNFLHVEIISAPIMYEGKLSAVSILRDITARKEAEAALRTSEERHRIMLETMPDLLFIMSGDGDYLDVKQSESVSLARPAEELIGRNVRDVLSLQEAEESLARVRRTLKLGGVQTNEYTLVFDGEQRHFEARMVKLGENEVLSVITDITDRKQAEQRSLELALERERVELLATFITNASHEFRTPLSIIGLKTFLVQSDPSPEKRDAYLAEIREQVESLSSLIDALLVMTRIDSQSKIVRKQMDFGAFMTAICASANQQVAKANLTLTCEMPPALPPFSGNMPYLQRAFENLLHNAIQYTSEGGAITVRTVCDDDAIVVTIQDTGPGMAEDQRKRSFERFYRGDQSHSTRGFGLGLPFAKVVFERHGGTITLESEPGMGTTLRVTLPLDN